MNEFYQINLIKDQSSYDKILNAKHQLEMIFDLHQEGLVLLNRELKIIRINKTMAGWVGQRPADVVGKTCYQGLWTLPRPCTFCPVNNIFTTGEAVHGIEETLEIDGQQTFWSISYLPVVENGRVEMVMERYRDITEEKKFFEMQIRTEKLISLGMMVAGVAHEIMNPLSGISGIANNMLNMPERYGINETGQDRIHTILDSATRMRIILTDLLNFSGPKQYTMKKADLRQLIEKAFSIIHLKGFKEIETSIHIEDEDNITEIMCDSEKILISLGNLIHNAAYSVMEKAKQQKSENNEYQGYINVTLKKRDKKLIILVTDNGMGIFKSDMPRIFDPFFTTKSPGEGTGLGLSITNQIIIEHQGALFVNSSPVKTVFTIELPIDLSEEKNP
jgi:PAS domain S-box-containing protein